MSDPRRWLESDDVSSEERDMLRSGLKLEASDETVEQMWAALAVLPAGGGPEGGDGGTSPQVASSNALPTTSLGTLGVKLGLGTILLAGMGLGLWLGLRREPQVRARESGTTIAQLLEKRTFAQRESSSEATEAEPAKASEVIAAVPRRVAKTKIARDVQDNRTTDAPEPDVSSQARAWAESGANALLEESRALEASKNSLSRGDYDAAVSQLNAMEARFPMGILGQEREALLIEALWKSGQKRTASQRASEFLDRFPGSPHAARLRGFISTP
jgi:hypothetical protein